MNWRTLVKVYEKGQITEHELQNRIFDLLDETNVIDFLDNVPMVRLWPIESRLGELPIDDQGWSRMISFSISTHDGKQEDPIPRMRKGVEILRKHINSHPRTGDRMICVCHLCWPNAVEWCELMPGCYLFENEGKWGLMSQPGHKQDHIVLMFPARPWPDPDPETEHDGDEIAAAEDLWLKAFDDNRKTGLVLGDLVPKIEKPSILGEDQESPHASVAPRQEHRCIDADWES